MANLSQPATLGHLKHTVDNIKVYIDSDKTISIKGHLKKNNTHCFYSTNTPTEDTPPVFSFDVAEEMFLDQAKTKFVPNFVWSATTYEGSTNPNLDGKPVMVLAVKGDESVTYSFLNLEELVDTYRTKDTSSLSLSISDEGEISGDVKVSEKEGNIITVEEDGLYATGEESMLVSFVYESTGDNTWTVHSVDATYDEIKAALSENKRVIAKGTNKNARLDNPWYFYPNEYYDSSGNWVVFERVEANGTTIEAFNFTVKGDGTATLVETEINTTMLQKAISGTVGQLVSFDEDGNAIATDVELDYADYKTSTVTDMNNLKEDGSYYFGAAITNCPSGMDRFVTNVFTWYRYVVQVVFGFKASTTSSATTSTPSIQVRMYDTMLYSWTSWSLLNKTTPDSALSSTSTNAVQNKVVKAALDKKQDALEGTENQLVSFDADGKIKVLDDTPAFAATYNGSNNDERIEISSSSLVIKQHFRRAKIQLANVLPSSYSVRGGAVDVDVFRLIDGSYKAFSTVQPIVAPSAANKLSVYYWSASLNFAEQADGSIKVTSTAGGAVSIIDVAAGTLSGTGSGGAGGDFNAALVWF